MADPTLIITAPLVINRGGAGGGGGGITLGFTRYIYKAGNVRPANPTISVNSGTGAITIGAPGWSQIPPSSGKYFLKIIVVEHDSVAGFTIASQSTPKIVNPITDRVIRIFNKSATAPTAPTASQFSLNPSTGAYTLPSGWSENDPSAPTGSGITWESITILSYDEVSGYSLSTPTTPTPYSADLLQIERNKDDITSIKGSGYQSSTTLASLQQGLDNAPSGGTTPQSTLDRITDLEGNVGTPSDYTGSGDVDGNVFQRLRWLYQAVTDRVTTTTFNTLSNLVGGRPSLTYYYLASATASSLSSANANTQAVWTWLSRAFTSIRNLDNKIALLKGVGYQNTTTLASLQQAVDNAGSGGGGGGTPVPLVYRVE